MSLFEDASLIVTPNGRKAGKIYALKPFNGSGDLTVVRATTKTEVNASGVIVDVPINVPSFDYTNASCPSILVEPQRTNLVFPSDIATTQTRTVTATAHTLSFYGTGTVTLSGVATGTLNGTGINNKVSLTFTPTAGSLILTVSGSVNNWQLEAGSNATSYIPTTTTSVTRNADVISKTEISSLIGQTEGTLYCEIQHLNFNQNSAIFVVQNNSNQLQNRLGFRYDASTGFLNAFIRVGSSFIVNLPGIEPFIGAKYKMCFTYNQIEQKLFINGVLANSRTGSYTQPATLDQCQLGNMANNAAPSSVLIHSALIIKTKISDTEAIQLTTL